MESKDKIWIYGLRLIGILVILLGVYWFFDCKLYEETKTNFQLYLKIFLSILVIVILSILFGISKILFRLFNEE